MRTPSALLCELLALYYGWTAFQDGPLAFYVSVGLWVAWRCWLLYLEHGRGWLPVCVYGAGLGLMQASCGLMFAADGRSFVCDSGTGLPISALVLAGGASVAAHYLRVREHGQRT
jgi:hypothetical protein